MEYVNISVEDLNMMMTTMN